MKTYILDHGILISNPLSLLSFDEHNIVLAQGSIRTLVSTQSASAAQAPGEARANAREALRLIAQYLGKTLPGGGTLSIAQDSNYINLAGDTPPVKVCGMLEDGIIVTNSNITQIDAIMHGAKFEPYTTEQVAPPREQYKGRRDLFMSEKDMSALFNGFALDAGQYAPDIVENEYLLIRDLCNPEHTALAKCRDGKIVRLKNVEPVYGANPRKVGQRFALDALLAPVEEIPLVILKGPAGTAKTFLSLAAALEQTVNGDKYNRILVTRPNIKFDNDIGYLKGSEEEKIGPLIRPIMDNLELLCSTPKNAKDGVKYDNYVQDLFDTGKITAQAMAYMRGRSIANTFIIIDEAQNMTPSQAFGIVSRIGIGSKVVLAGDPEQIDSPDLDSRNNGLSYASEKMRGSPVCAQVTFEPTECVRSPLALEAIKRMSGKNISI